MIRFQICIFDILNTASVFQVEWRRCCDSLSNLYLWHIKYSQIVLGHMMDLVVIRFQICIFDILNTAVANMGKADYCCDSLSNLYLWHIKYSYLTRFEFLSEVVIRFQICIFDILNTAYGTRCLGSNLLWFAFKFVSLTY